MLTLAVCYQLLFMLTWGKGSCLRPLIFPPYSRSLSQGPRQAPWSSTVPELCPGCFSPLGFCVGHSHFPDGFPGPFCCSTLRICPPISTCGTPCLQPVGTLPGLGDSLTMAAGG